MYSHVAAPHHISAATLRQKKATLRQALSSPSLSPDPSSSHPARLALRIRPTCFAIPRNVSFPCHTLHPTITAPQMSLVLPCHPILCPGSQCHTSPRITLGLLPFFFDLDRAFLLLFMPSLPFHYTDSNVQDDGVLSSAGHGSDSTKPGQGAVCYLHLITGVLPPAS